MSRPRVSRNANSVVAYSQQSSAKWRPNTSCADRRAGHDDATKAAKHHVALSGDRGRLFVDPDFPAPTDSICEKSDVGPSHSRSQSITCRAFPLLLRRGSVGNNRSDGAFRGGRPDDLVSLRISALVLSRKAREWICSKSP